MQNEIEKPKTATQADIPCWEVEIHNMTCYVFAATAAKARYGAVKAYWEAFGRRLGEWPRATSKKIEPFRRKPERLIVGRAYGKDELDLY